MTGWLPKEILDHLDHAGYIAIPRERLDTLTVREFVSDMELMRSISFQNEHSFQVAQRKRMAMQLAVSLLEKGFIDVQTDAPDKDGMTAHTATLHVIKPRTIRKEP